MTTERINAISDYLAKDLDGAKALLAMSPEEAAAKISENGFSVTSEELVEYGEAVKKIAAEKDGELVEGELENVAGGIAASTIILGSMVVGFLIGKGVW